VSYNPDYYKRWYILNREKVISSVKQYQKGEKYRTFRKKLESDEQHKSKKREYTKVWHLKRKYGLTLSDLENMIKRQNKKCGLCNKPLSTKNRKKFHVDHCHKSGKIRAILHNTCNNLLGFAHDDVELLENAIRYLKNHN
jgi:hypothetical protein